MGRLKAELGECDNIYDEQKLQYRVAALSGGIAAIKCVCIFIFVFFVGGFARGEWIGV